MISKNKKPVEIKVEYSHTGNWNYKHKDKPPVYTKPIAIIKIDGDEFVFSHSDILRILEAYYHVDEESIMMISGVNVDTGEIKALDERFTEKIKRFIREKNSNDLIKVERQAKFNFLL